MGECTKESDEIIHAKLDSNACAFCYSPLQPKDCVTAVLREDISTHYTRQCIYSDGVCQIPTCFNCRIGPYGFIFHIDCFYLVQLLSHQSKLPPGEVWELLSSWTSSAPLTTHERNNRARHAYETYILSQREDIAKISNLDRLCALPQELYEQIMTHSWSYGVHAYTVIRAEAPGIAAALGQNLSTQQQISLLKPLYLHYAVKAGVMYVSDISNIRLQTQIWDGSPVSKISLTSNEFGVIGISITGHKNTTTRDVQQTGALWYKTIMPCLETPLEYVTIHSKGSVRDICRLGEEGEREPYWDCLSPPALGRQSRYVLKVNQAPPMFMRYIELCNDITGITAACYQGILHLFAHRPTTLPHESMYTRIESLAGKNLVWIHFPMSNGESISAVWIRKRALSLNDHCSQVILQTSQKRCVNFGEFVHDQEYSRYEFRQLSGPPSQITGLCMNDLGAKGSSNFVFAVAHETLSPTQGEPPPLSTKAISMPRKYVIGRWFHSQACLTGVSQMQLCIDRSLDHRPYIGMLLTYSDGHSETLGQWRPDCLGSIFQPKECFFIYMAGNGRQRYVRYISLEREGTDGWEEDCLKVSVHDTLSWWFTPEEAELFVKKAHIPFSADSP